MKCLSVAAVAVVAFSAFAQAPPNASSTSLAGIIQQLPSMVANHFVNDVAFSRMLEIHLSDSPTEVEAVLPLLQKYLLSSDIEIRRNTLLIIYALAQRPNSKVELSSLLPALYAHLGEHDRYLRQGALVGIAALHPAPPPEALAALASALATADPSDGFGTALAGTLAKFNPDSEETQTAVLTYMRRPELTDAQRADLIFGVASPTVGDRITQEIVQLARTSPPGRLRNGSIVACATIGPRAVNQITPVIDAIQSNSGETPDAHAAATRALAVMKRQ